VGDRDGERVTEHDAAFREFVSGSQHRLVNFGVFLVGDRGRAEDLVQDAYVRAYVNWSRIHDRAPEAYVRKCIINGRADWWRRRSSKELVSIGQAQLEGIDNVDATGDVDQRLLVAAALSRLTKRERTVIVLRYYLGLSEAEIAAELGLAAGTVKSTASRATQKLRADDLLREGATHDPR
jgi:RNA polymerase sigma-70 factor (sigma-E family)